MPHESTIGLFAEDSHSAIRHVDPFQEASRDLNDSRKVETQKGLPTEGQADFSTCPITVPDGRDRKTVNWVQRICGATLKDRIQCH